VHIAHTAEVWWEAALLNQPGILGSWPNRECEANDCRSGGCEFSQGDFTKLDSPLLIVDYSWHITR
jgi:hypothetical protein